jgi:hypothetical protein
MCGMVRFGYSHAGCAAWRRAADLTLCSCAHYSASGWDPDGAIIKGVSKACYDLGAVRYNGGDYEGAVLPLSRACAIAEWR